MHRLISFFIAILLFASYSACSHIGRKYFLYEAVLTVAHTFPVHDAFYPIEMYVKNNELILCQTNTPISFPDVFFQAYSLADYSCQGLFGFKGRGPGEWLLPQIVGSSLNSPYLYLHEVSSRQPDNVIYKMILDSTTQLNQVETFFVKTGPVFMNRPVINGDSLLVFIEYLPEQAIRVHHLNQERPVITWNWGTLPPQQVSYDENFGTLCANDSYIVYLYRYQERIDFMDWNLKLKRSLNYQKSKPVIGKDMMDNVNFYGRSFLGEHFLYTFHFGKSLKESEINDLGTALEVFDLNGTPVCRYTFPQPRPHIFTVDERTFTLYGFRETENTDDAENYITVYHMPELKEYFQKNNL